MTFVFGVIVGLGGSPLWKTGLMAFHEDQFGLLTYRCDHAMRSHMIAKQRLAISPSAAAVDEVRAMEIGLIDCQDYDLMRKRLIRLGLSDNELSEMSLRAIEARSTTLQDVIQVHEIRY